MDLINPQRPRRVFLADPDVSEHVRFGDGPGHLFSTHVMVAHNSVSAGLLVSISSMLILVVTEQFRSNWELSVGRAASFVFYLEANGVDPRRLVVHGYGPNRPLADNESEENRAMNRRIEILLKESKDDPEAAAALAEVIDG